MFDWYHDALYSYKTPGRSTDSVKVFYIRQEDAWSRHFATLCW